MIIMCNFVSDVKMFVVWIISQLRTKIRTLPEKRVANERSLTEEQKRYDDILQLAPAKETVSLLISCE